MPNAVVEHAKLSIEAKGLHVYVLSRPPNWHIRPKQLGSKLRIGRDRLQRIRIAWPTTICGTANRIGRRPRWLSNANMFVDDILLFDVAKPITDASHLEIERSTLNGKAYQTGGGRTVDADVIDILLTWIVNHDREFLEGGTTKATKPEPRASHTLPHRIWTCRRWQRLSMSGQRPTRCGS